MFLAQSVVFASGVASIVVHALQRGQKIRVDDAQAIQLDSFLDQHQNLPGVSKKQRSIIMSHKRYIAASP